MKIGIDVRLWEETGVGRYIRNLVTNIAAFDTKNDYILFACSKDKEKISYAVSNTNWKLVIADIRWHSLKEQVSLSSLLNKEQLDLMHFPYFSLPISYKKPFIVTIHDLIIHHFPTGKASTLPLPLYQIKRFGYTRVLKHAVRHTEKIIVPLESVKHDLIDALGIPGEKIAVTFEGFDPDFNSDRRAKKNAFSEEAYFLYVGNAYPHKNLTVLLEAFQLFRKSNPDQKIRLLLVGKDDFFYTRLRKQIIDEKLQSVDVINNVSDIQLADLYRHAICLISPSKMEGFGLTALEAIALSCIPLVSDIPSFREVCGDGAVYFHHTSAKDLHDKMLSVVAMGETEKAEMKSKGMKRLGMFSWKEMAQETVKIYESCSSK